MTTSLTRFSGGRELQEALNKLPAQIERNILRSALRQGANVIKEEAQRLAPVDSGDLRKSIRVKTRSRRGMVRATVEAGNEIAFYAHMIEFGTRPHWIEVRRDVRPTRLTRKGLKAYSVSKLNDMAHSGSLVIGTNFVGASVAHPGTRPRPFMQPALDNKVNEAVKATGEQIRKRLTKEGLNAPPPLDIDDE